MRYGCPVLFSLLLTLGTAAKASEKMAILLKFRLRLNLVASTIASNSAVQFEMPGDRENLYIIRNWGEKKEQPALGGEFDTDPSVKIRTPSRNVSIAFFLNSNCRSGLPAMFSLKSRSQGTLWLTSG